MKKLILILLFIITVFATTINGNEIKDAIYANHKDGDFLLIENQLLEQIQKKGFVRIMVDIKYAYDENLSKEDQREIILKKQEDFIEFIGKKKINVSSIKRGLGVLSPWIAINVDQKSLVKILKNPIVDNIYLDEPEKLFLDESIFIIQANDVWNNMGITGEGQTIVILDTGVDYEHDFFDNRVVYGACFSTNDSNYNSTSLCPNEEEEQFGISAGKPCIINSACDHGTHVAGIAAGSETNDLGSGVAPGASIISVQVFSFIEDPNVCYPNNSCIRSFIFDQERALEWLYDIHNDFEIASVNMSLGGGNHSSPCDNDNRKPFIDDLASIGITTIAASGNNGYEDALSAPACISSVISVGATNKDDTHRSTSNAAPFLDLVAPGSSITSSVPGNNYASKGGTSMAAPHVAGVVALMKSLNPDLTPDEIRTYLHNSADKVPGMNGQNFTNEYGYGRLNAYKNLQSKI